MKFTSEDLMKAMGLQVGDRIRVGNDIYTLVKEDDIYIFEYGIYRNNIVNLIDLDYEILPRPKRVGDLKCDEKCNSCPIKIVCNIGTYNDDWSLYEVLKDTQVEFCDQEIHDLLKARLDKVVE